MNSFGDTLLARFIRNSDILIAVGVISVVIMMIVPLPSFILDILMALNISIGMAILLISMYMENVLDFSVFPSLLLVVTLFRLALNVSSTRLILLMGTAFDGKIIRTFGDFVVGGNYVVGLVIFIILVIIQFVVITRGATRVAEVAARFTLDAMPGKQMSIDADLQAGLITEQEAKQKRKDIQREADFYGAMDGSSKFVSGDAVAGIIITIINVLGGLIIGVWQRGEGIVEAMQVYTLLTVGDGLVSQLPALLISTATGIIVTRAASESNLGQDLTRQFLVDPKIYFIIGSMLLLLTMVPGLPKISFLILAGLSLSLAFALKNKKEAEKAKPVEDNAAKEAEKKKMAEDVSGLMVIDPMELEIGYSLIPLVDAGSGGDLLERIKLVRRQTVLDLGIKIPSVRVRDNMQIDPSDYTIMIKGFEVGKGHLMMNHFLALNTSGVEEKIDGIPAKDPVYNIPGFWVNQRNREIAAMAGYSIFDPSTIIITHLTEVIKRHAHELFGQEELLEIIKNLARSYPTLTAEIQKAKCFENGVLLKTLHNLLKEGVSIRNMVPIMETALEKSKLSENMNVEWLTIFCRNALAPIICKKYLTDGVLNVIKLHPDVEELMQKSIQGNDIMGKRVSIDHAATEKIAGSVKGIMAALQKNQISHLIILTDPQIRYYVKQFMDFINPEIVVLSYYEILPDISLQALGEITLD